MTATTKPTRAELVRRRRIQQTKNRSETTAARAMVVNVRPSTANRPLAQGKRRVAEDRRGNGHRRFEIAWPSAPTLSLPTLPRYSLSWRMASFSMVLLLGAMLARLLIDPNMFVDGINLGGAALVPGEEIYAQSGIARQHIFWVDPLKVKENVESIPGIAQATVTIHWPNSVTIVVRERVPVVTWIEGERTWWVDDAGQKFVARGDLPGLIPVMVDDATEVGGALHMVPAEAVRGAVQLKQLRANIELLHYDALHGLSYQDGRGWRGYFGAGLEMAQKLAVYETLTDNLLARGIRPALVSVETAEAPYYRK